MAQPTTSILLNKTTPAAPSDLQNVVFQTDNGVPQQQVTAYMPTATDSLAGAIIPDGTTCTVDGTGKLTVTGIESSHALYSEPVCLDGEVLFIAGDVLVLGVTY